MMCEYVSFFVLAMLNDWLRDLEIGVCVECMELWSVQMLVLKVMMKLLVVLIMRIRHRRRRRNGRRGKHKDRCAFTSLRFFQEK